MDVRRARHGQPPLAFHAIRHPRRVVDADFAQESGTDSLLALAGGMMEISSSRFVAGRHRQTSGETPQLQRNTAKFVRRHGRGQPTLHAVHPAHRFCGCAVDDSADDGPSAASAARGNLAQRSLRGFVDMVYAVATYFRGDAGIDAVEGRPRRGILRCLERMGRIRKPIKIVLSRAYMEPGIFGILRSVLMWPEGIFGVPGMPGKCPSADLFDMISLYVCLLRVRWFSVAAATKK